MIISFCLCVPEESVYSIAPSFPPTQQVEATISDFKASPFILPWEYCDLRRVENNLSREEKLLFLLKKLSPNDTFNWQALNEKCKLQLLKDLIFDAQITRNAMTNWIKSNQPYNSASLPFQKTYDVTSVYLATRTGLTRFYHFGKPVPHNDSYLLDNVDPVSSVIFSRTLAAPIDSFVLSLKLNPGNHELDLSQTHIHVSTAISLSNEESSVSMGSLTMQMLYKGLVKMFHDSVHQDCEDKRECNISCIEHQNVDCYLLDENGYVVLSANSELDVGKFFSKVESLASIADELVTNLDIDEGESLNASDDEKEEDNDGNFEEEYYYPDKNFKGIFRMHLIQDQSSVCRVHLDHQSTATRRISAVAHILLKISENFLNQLFCLIRTLLALICYVPTILSQESYPDYWYNSLNQSQSSLDFDHLDDFYSTQSDQISEENVTEISKNTKTKKKEKESYIYKACTKKHRLYKAQWKRLPQHHTSTTCVPTPQRCVRPYSAINVPRSNLILLVLDSTCSCDIVPQSTNAPSQVINEACIEKKSMYRKPPRECFKSHAQESLMKCGFALGLQPEWLWILSLIIPLIHIHH